jgi:hypothetical protein
VSRAGSLGLILGRSQELALEPLERRARLLNEGRPPVPTTLWQHLFGNDAHPAVAGVADRAAGELGVFLDGAQDDVAAGDVVDAGRLIDVDAAAEEEVDDAFFEDARWQRLGLVTALGFDG